MIPLNLIQNIKKAIVHGNCPDGLVSAILLKDAVPHIEIKFIQYNTAEHIEITPEEGLIFADFTPHNSKYQEFVATNTIVLDHHKSQRHIVEAFGDNGVFGDEINTPGMCGAVLVFECIWKPLRKAIVEKETPWFFDWVSDFARLAGIRDTWQKHDPDWVKASKQAELVMFLSAKFWMNNNLRDVAESWSSRLWVADYLSERYHQSLLTTIEKAYRFEMANGCKVLVFDSTSKTSDATEVVGDTVDLIVGFSYKQVDGKIMLVLSTRATENSNFDCAKFTSSFGGGGHSKAAGLGLSVNIHHDKNPYLTIQNLLEYYFEHIVSS